MNTAADEPTVLVEDHGPWAVVSFNRPDKRNAFDNAMTARLSAVLDELLDKRVIVLTGKGSAFSAGMDLVEAQQQIDQVPASRRPSGRRHPWLALHEQLRRHPAVFIAAVNGFALGGGSTFVNNCDLAIAADSATIGTPEISFGQFPQPSAAAMVQRLLPKHAAEVVLLAKRVDAPTAYRMGMVNEVVPAADLLTRAGEIAEHIAQFDDILLDWAKKGLRAMVNTSWDEAIELGESTGQSVRASRQEATGFTMRDFAAGRRSSTQGS